MMLYKRASPSYAPPTSLPEPHKSGNLHKQSLRTVILAARNVLTALVQRPSTHTRLRTQATTMGLRPREVETVIQGQKMMEGAGVRICRTLGTSKLRNLDPFLMLDELRMPAREASAGFPDHPHRGFETCSIMFSGKMEHHDSVGNQGVIGPGGVQWMTAGRGIVHSEMPKVTEGDLWGFQLWINLPAKDKMVKPRYQDYQADEIKTVQNGGARIRVMAGDSHGLAGPVAMRNPGLLLDVTLQKGATFTQELDSSWNGFIYVCDGEGSVAGTAASKEQALVLGKGSCISATTESEGGMRFLLIAGKPIGEPIVQYGPFVMNTQEQIEEAFRDHQRGLLQNPTDDVWAAA